MLYTKGEWIEDRANNTTSHMRFILADVEDVPLEDENRVSWEAYLPALPIINEIVERYGLQKYAHINYGGNTLDISFHAHGDDVFPDTIKDAEREIDEKLGLEIRPRRQDGNI